MSETSTSYDRLYFCDDKRKTFRVVQPLGPDTFVVVKIFEGRIRTVKFWRGDLNATVKHWSTKICDPTPAGKHMLDIDFTLTLQEFGPAFQIALSL